MQCWKLTNRAVKSYRDQGMNQITPPNLRGFDEIQTGVGIVAASPLAGRPRLIP